MSYVNLNNPANFQLQEFEQLGFRYIVSGRPTIGGETYRTIFVLTDAVVTATCPNGDSLSSETLVAGTVIHGFFEDVSVASGSLLAYKAGPITAQEIFDAYKAYVYAQGGIVEGESCAVADIAALLEDKLYSAASLVLIPSGYKVSHLYAERPLDSNGDFTFTRASSATRVNSSGLIEKSRENVLLQSNQFDTTWITSSSSLTGGQSGYDGSSDAWLLSQNGGVGYVVQVVSQSGVYTLSVYAKAGSYDWLRLRINTTGTAQNAYFNLSGGGSIGGSGVGVDKTIESIAGGWYKCSITSATESTSIRIYPAFGDGDVSGTSGNIYIQDAQLEQGLVATDYIETTTTSVVSGIINNMPRLDYSGGASCPSLLLEPSRTNLILYSEYIDSYWNPFGNISITDNDSISPEGVQNATKISAAATTTALIGIQRGVSVTANNDYTISFFAKKGDFRYVQLFHGGGQVSTNARTNFDLQEGVVAYEESGVVTASVDDYGNGWYRCIATMEALTSNLQAYIVVAPTADATRSPSISANAGDAYQIYGIQMELGSYPTSYIPTYGTSATRTVDSCYKTGISSLIGQTEGTIYIEVNTNQHISELSDDTSANRIVFYTDGSDYLRNLIRASASTSSNIQTNTTIQAGDKIALAYANNDAVIYKNGVQIGSDTSVTIPATSKINVGSDYNEISNTTNSVNQVLLFKTRLTNAQLAELTTL